MTTMPDQESSTEQPRKAIGNNIHLKFEMGADASAGMAEEKAKRFIERYFIDTEYRFTVHSDAIVIGKSSGDEVIGYRVKVQAWRYEGGEW